MSNISDLIGKPFVDGGRGPEGYDCWGLAREVWSRLTGQELQDYTISCMDAININQQISRDLPRQWVKAEGEPPTPSIVIMRFNSSLCNHIGVYVGVGYFLHTRRKVGAVKERIDSPVWGHLIEGFYIPKG